jgi:hypothetical protein
MSDPVKGETGSAPAPETKLCANCGEEIPKTATKCKHCSALQYETKQCAVCGQYIPVKAKRCTECDSYQSSILRFGSSMTALALMVAVLTQIASILSQLTIVEENVERFLNRNSKTTVTFQNATENVINITATNTGRKPSELRRFRLVFGDPSVEDTDLEVASNASQGVANIVPANGGTTISLKTDDLTRHVPWPALPLRLNDHPITLEVDTEESNGPRKLKTTFEGRRAIGFILHYAPQRDEDKNKDKDKGGPP